jgi:predicted DNA-binding transcriptional regulator AlpA
MQYISARQYADIKGLSLGYVYELMRDGKLPWEPQNKVVKRIPWDETKQEAVKQN